MSRNPPVLTKRVSFSFPDDEPRPVIIGAEDDSRPSLIGYPSPPSSNEDALETNDNFLSENFLPSEGSQLDGGLQIDTEDDSIIDTEINQFDAAPFQLSPEISEIDPSTASPQDGFNFLYPVDEYSSPLLAQRRFATTELAAGEETRFDGSSFPEGNGHDTRA